MTPPKKQVLPNVILVGPMAAGKSTIGRLLAQELGRHFYDTDHELEHNTGVRVAWIYDLEGEEGFKKREEAIIEKLTQLPHIVLATGGASILSELSREVLKKRGYVIHLRVSLAEQIKRTLKDKHRPLIQTRDRKAALEKLYAEREPLYEAVAHWGILTDSGPSTRIVREIVAHLRSLFV